MATFTYTAVDKLGKQKRGNIDALNPDRAMVALKAEGLIPVKVQEASIFSQDIQVGGKKASAHDLALFCNQFESILNAGVPVIDALGMLAEQTENKAFAKAIIEVKTSVERGESLGGAMAARKDVFPSMLISMVQAGEASGSLEVSLNRMAIQFDKDTKLKATIKKALTYPAVVLVVMFAVILVLLYYVIPTFMSMFADMDIEMPALTMFVMNASDFVQNYWYIILAVVVIIVIAWKTFSSTMTGKIAIGKFTLWCPLSKNFVIKTASARLARTLSTLTAAGISMIEALDITSKTMTNVILRMAVMDAKEDVKKGVPLSEGLKKSGVFPPMLLHMTKIGENTGDMEAMLTKMANYYDEEVENATAQLMAMIEPMITVVMAGLVGVIVGAVLMPMVALYDGLENI